MDHKYILILFILLSSSAFADIDSHVVTRWDMETTTGKYIADTVGSNNLENNSASYFPACKYGGCYHFDDASNNYMNGSNPAPLQLTTDYTISLWVKLTTNGDNQRLISKDDNVNRAFALQFNHPDTYNFYKWIGGGSVSVSAPNNATPGIWQHIAVAVNNTKMCMFINGKRVNCANAGIGDNDPAQIELGRKGGAGSNYFNGYIDEIMIIDKRLNDTQINETYISQYPYSTGTVSTFSVQDIYTASNYGDFTITAISLMTGDINTSNSTGITATLTLNRSQNYLINVTSITNKFAYSEANVSGNTSLYVFNVYPFNSIDISIFDEDTLDLINTTNMTLTYTIGATSLTAKNDTGYISLSNLTTGTYTFKFTGSGYYERYYYVSIGSGSHSTMNAYLVDTATGTNINIFLYCSGSALTNNTISLYKKIGGNYVTVAQRITDATGNAPFYLNPSTTYRFIIVSPYGTYLEDFTPSQTPISIDVCGGNTVPYNWTTVFDKFSYALLPQDYLLYPNVTQFNLSATSTGGYINSFRLSYNSSISNMVSGSPSGGSTNITLDLSSFNWGPVRINFWFNISGETEILNMTRDYYLQIYWKGSNTSVMSVLNDVGTETQGLPYPEKVIEGFLLLLASIIAVVSMSLVNKIAQPEITALVGLAVFIICAIPPLSWFSWYFLIPPGMLIGLYYILSSRLI